MSRTHNRAFLALGAALLCATSYASAPPKIAFETVADWTAGPVTLPDVEYQATLPVATSIPGLVNGASINTLLGADTFYNAGLTGSNASVANVEAGHVWNGHETLGHVNTFANSLAAWNDPGTRGQQQQDLVDRHATWVASMIAGRNGGAVQGDFQRGIAFGADLQSGAVATAWNGAAYALGFNSSPTTVFTAYNAYFGSSDVINSSWSGTDPEGDNSFATLLDALANQNPTTSLVVSAGNSGPGTNTVGFPGSGYNAITVGALENNGANAYESVASFSSRGPQRWAGGGLACNDCRAPVDLVAPGTTLVGAFYGGTTGGNNPTLAGSAPSGGPNFYSSPLAGTSFSSPIVAGAATLVADASKATPELAGNTDSRDARVVKAVLLNSAEKIDGWDNGQQDVGGVVQTNQSLDYTSGAGALDIEALYHQYLQAPTRDVPGAGSGDLGSVAKDGWDYGEVQSGVDNIYHIGADLPRGAEITVTLAWFRERAETFLANSTVQDLAQADLDLIVRDTTTDLVVAQSVSAVNVVEHLHFRAPTASRYQIEVNLFGTIFGAVNSEEYGLAWAVVVPEPSGMALAAALLGLCGFRRARSG